MSQHLAEPPVGKKGGYAIVGEDGKITTEKQEYERDEFWASTSNKQLNFLQHIVARDKANLDILWLKDESLEDVEE